MKNKKGFTWIEGLIILAIFGLVAAIVIPNIIKATQQADKNYRVPVQRIKEQARSERIAVTKVGEMDDLTFYIVRDLNNNNEYLISQFQQFQSNEGSVSSVRMARSGE